MASPQTKAAGADSASSSSTPAASSSSSSASASGALFIGVDGGGTKTAISLLDEHNVVLSEVRVGSSNPNSVGEQTATQNVQDGIRQAIQQAGGGATLGAVRGVVLSIAGCNNALDAERMCGWAKPLFANQATLPQIHAYNDAVAALVAGTHGIMNGIVVIAGTGMICKGFLPDPHNPSVLHEVTTGGNGALIDDGSGYSIGLDVLRATFASADGMGPRTPLHDAVLSKLRLANVEQLVDWIYADKSWERVAALAPLAFKYGSYIEGQEYPDSAPAASVADASASSSSSPSLRIPDLPAAPFSASTIDAVAAHILEKAASYLVRSVRAAAERLGVHKGNHGDEINIACSGGIILHPHMFHLVSKGIHQFMPLGHCLQPTIPASQGAAMLAKRKWKETLPHGDAPSA